MSKYVRHPGFLKSDFSWEQSNAIMNKVLGALQNANYPVVSRKNPSILERRRYDSMAIEGEFFQLALQYVAPEGKEKGKVVAELTLNGPADNRYTTLNEVVTAAIRK